MFDQNAGDGRMSNNSTFQLDDFDWDVLLTKAKDLQIGKKDFLRLHMTVYLDAQEVALILPVELALDETNTY
jgi:hypothetical protein